MGQGFSSLSFWGYMDVLIGVAENNGLWFQPENSS